MMNRPQYTNQHCSMTLKEGLEEYYNFNPPQIKEYSKKVPLLVEHDITHVIFGLGTSIQEESLLDTWTIRGTDITWKQIYHYAFDKELKKFTKIIVREHGGWINIIKTVVKCFPRKMKIHFNRIPKMKKKWPYSKVTNAMMDCSIIDLRNEYGIKIISC